jgi:CheY-like chemotaxis protein
MKRIVVIEDNHDNADLIEAFLEDDYKLYFAYDGLSGLNMVKDIKPDLVLLDISLPEMDGNEVVKAIRKDNDILDIPVIALTAHAMLGDKEVFLKKGFNDYMSKPILDEDKLIDMIEDLINK